MTSNELTVRVDRQDGVDQLRGFIGRVRRRWFAAVALRAIGLGAAAAAVPALAAGLAYWTLSPRGVPLLVLSAVALCLCLAGVAAVVRRIERRPDDRRVARFIEERAERHAGLPAMNDCVVSAVQAAVPDDRAEAAVASLVVDAALRCLEGVTPAHLIPQGDVRRAAGITAGGVSLLVATLVVTAPALSHVVETAQLRLFPSSIVVEVLPGDARVVAGQPLRIRARLNSGKTDLWLVQPKLVVAAGADERTVEMTAAGDGFEFTFESVDRTFTYRVTAGAVRSADYTVTAMFAPRVKRIDVDYRYPSFSGLAPRTEEDGGDIYAPAGTSVRLRIHLDKPVASAELALSGGKSALTQAGSDVVQGELVLTKDDSYRIRLTDRDGLRSDGESEYFIRLMDDRPPDVRILRPSADQGITPLEEVAIEARAEDDYGVASLDLVYSVAGGKEHVVPFSGVTGGETQRAGTYLLAAEELAVRPGDVITYYARARDVGRGKRPSVSTSDIFFLEVRPFNEEFVAAQSQAGAGGGGDPQIEALIDAQKEIITATWNIERRANAGRSSDDIKAVAQAQSELRDRVERILAAARGRRSRGIVERIAPQSGQPGRPATSDPIGSAVEAMQRAIEQLSSGRTRDAISHEMAALNGLVQAQAEVRRRQVTQQANSSGGGGWGNRQTQDLSALFDKELQRQQRTNYEQRSQIEERPDQRQAGQDMLDRIRDLARRQEALSRAQREAAQLAADERKRQLEKLTREQQELQRQTEELSRQMASQQSSQSSQQQSGQQQQQGQQQSGQQQSGQQQSGQQQGSAQEQRQSGQTTGSSPAMRDAVEQMRQAANDMGREDAESAARRGERAAEQLRNLEQQMRGDSNDARQRAAADLQAEAQQILQEQRRIASEAERLDKGGKSADADARRRLAADKDRLADRVDRLQKDAQQLGSQGGKGTEQTRARDAAGQLQKERVGDRMRTSAQDMREGTKPAASHNEQQLARAMEQVVEKLGGAATAEARQMAEQLEQSRQTRERLDQMETQMRKAEGKGDGQFEKLRQQYEQELRRTRESLGRQGSEQRDGTGRSTPEQHEFSRSAPGTEAFKQDRSEWQSLRRDVDQALQERESAASKRLANSLGDSRLSAGASDRVPEQYRRLIAKYYESLAKSRK